MAHYERKGSRITNLDTGKVDQYGFINEAKRASRAIQNANGGLGRGSVKVVRRKGGGK